MCHESSCCNPESVRTSVLHAVCLATALDSASADPDRRLQGKLEHGSLHPNGTQLLCLLYRAGRIA